MTKWGEVEKHYCQKTVQSTVNSTNKKKLKMITSKKWWADWWLSEDRDGGKGRTEHSEVNKEQPRTPCGSRTTLYSD